MSIKNRFFFSELARVKQDLGNYFYQLREDYGLSLEDVQNGINLKRGTWLEKFEQGIINKIFLIFRLCFYYRKRPVIHFIDIPEEEIPFTMESNHD